MSAGGFTLRFPKSKLEHWAARYPAAEDDAILALAAPARKRGYLTKREFIALGDWKTPRSRPHRLKNSEELIREATRTAFAAKSEELKIGILRLLEGVEWPTASVILHLCDRGDYPILDWRAYWSAGMSKPLPPYTFERWMGYTLFTRGLARSTGCSMREVDRALWQYSKEHESDT
jgi:hypothetical protein